MPFDREPDPRELRDIRRIFEAESLGDSIFTGIMLGSALETALDRAFREGEEVSE